jgi:cell fate (sporulation/competence/biofilm development) regulator YlbF (YheA/YmcA/DUF963 family)
MSATAEDTLLLQKTRELCQTLVDQPDFQQIRQRIDAFLSDDSAKNQYQQVMEKGDALQHKQETGQPLDGGEIADFEKNRDVLLGLPVAREFIEAQQRMHKMQESVIQYVSKTFELGRVPTDEDFSSGDCGPTCGCSH